jgi:phosphoglycolate phosphatase
MTNLVFDFDGTLHDTIRIYAPAFRKAYQTLADRGLAESREWTDCEIGGWLGYSSRDMWNMFMPGLPEDEKENCSRLIGEELISAIRAGRARLYEGAEEMLGRLKAEGYRLTFLSNCKIDYMRESIRCFSLKRFFEAFYCTEQYGFAPKHEIFNDILKAYTQFYHFGDRKPMRRLQKIWFALFRLCVRLCTVAELGEADGLAHTPAEIIPAIKILEV